MRYRGILTGLLLLAGLGAGEGQQKPAEAWRMRSRVFADPVSGTAFRFPFPWLVPDHCGDVVIEPRAYQASHLRQTPVKRRPKTATEAGDSATPPDQAVTPPAAGVEEPAAANILPPPAWITCGIRHFSRLPEELPGPVRVGGMEVIARHLGGEGLGEMTPFAYDEVADDRRHVVPWKDRPGVEGLTATGPAGRLLLVRHGRRHSGLLIGSDVPAVDAEAIVRSFELMRPFGKRLVTWREWQGLQRMAIDRDGAAVAVTACRSPATFNDSYEFESRFFHFSGMAMPQEMSASATPLDDLHRTLQGCLPLDRPPRVKFEILLAKTKEQFVEMVQRFSWNPQGVAAPPVTMQGSFNPWVRAQLTYTEVTDNTAGTTILRLNHETVHQYVYLHTGRWDLPQWFNEGLAVFFEAGGMSREQYVARPQPTRVLSLKLWYQQGNSLFATPAAYVAGSRIRSVHQYAEVAALVHSLLVAEPEGLTQLAACWRGLRARQKTFDDLLFDTLLARRLAAAGGDRQRALTRWGEEMVDYVTKDAVKKTLTIKPAVD